MPKLIFNPLSAKLDYVSTKADLDLSGTNSGDVTVTDTSTIDFTLTGQALSATVLPAGVDHGGLGGLLDDDHTQYALLEGRSGGQSLSGGTAANDDLTLQGTTNATRTSSYVLLQPNGGNVGIGTTSPGNLIHINSGATPNTAQARFTANGVGGFSVLAYAVNNIQNGFDADWSNGSWVARSTTAARIFKDGTYLSIDTDSGLTSGVAYSPTARLVILHTGNVGIGTTAPSAELHVDQTSTTAAKPTLRLQQADLSEEFIRFHTTVGTGNPTNTSALGTYYGRVRVYVEGVGEKWLALYNT